MNQKKKYSFCLKACLSLFLLVIIWESEHIVCGQSEEKNRKKKKENEIKHTYALPHSRVNLAEQLSAVKPRSPG